MHADDRSELLGYSHDQTWSKLSSRYWESLDENAGPCVGVAQGIAFTHIKSVYGVLRILLFPRRKLQAD